MGEWRRAIPDIQRHPRFAVDVEVRISNLLREIVPEAASRGVFDDNRLTHLLFMAFDGFAISHHLNGPSRRAEAICEMLTDLVMGAPASR